MFEIKQFNKIAACGTDLFDKSKYALNDSENPDGILVRSGDLLEMEFGDKLKAIARAGAGTNNIPIKRCSEAGIVVFNTPGANANAVKELVLTGMLLSSRKVADGIEWVKTIADKGDEIPALVEKGKSAFGGPEVYRKKFGVVGLGAIGVLVANAARSFGMDVMGYDPFMSVTSAWRISRHIAKINDITEIFKEADYISIHMPLNGETRGLFCEKTFAQMKDGVRILNFSRGEIVNDDDMAKALESGKVASYVTDFPNEKTLKMKNAICIPHLGASTPESEDNCAIAACTELIDYLENGSIVNSVNMPSLALPSTDMSRLCIIHRNIPHKITAITAAVSDCGINIENMFNKSKDEYGYTVLETIEPVSAEIVDKIKSIPDILSVRVI